MPWVQCKVAMILLSYLEILDWGLVEEAVRPIMDDITKRMCYVKGNMVT